jgi:hypothetical protein
MNIVKNIVLALCVTSLIACSKPKPLESYRSDLVWFAKFKHSYGGSDPMKEIVNSKGLFTIKRYNNRFEVNNANNTFHLTIDSLHSYFNSTRFFLKDRRLQLYQISIYTDSIQLKKGLVQIEFSSLKSDDHLQYLHWYPSYVYMIEATKL